MNKKIKITLIAIMLMIILTPKCFAITGNFRIAGRKSEVIFDDEGGSGGTSSSISKIFGNTIDKQEAPTGELNSKIAKIIKVFRNIAAVAAVVIISILGLKYMIGSTEERAEYKKSFIPLIVGIVVVVGAAQLATLFFSLGK